MSEDLEIKNIGELNGALLVFGGPYSNLQATQALLEHAKTFAIPPSNIICTGDITAYCGNPLETTKLVKSSGIHIIQGNCEESLAADKNDCGCGFDDESACNILSNKWYNFSKSQITPELATWMGDLPMRIEFTHEDKKYHVLHGSVDAVNEFIFPTTPEEVFEKQFSPVDADIILCGHSGIPFTKKVKDKIWHNGGAIGSPANDGTPRVWYSIIDGGKITHHALDYHHESAAKVMMDNGLNEYAKTIQTGLWPSTDILPEIEKAQTGAPLNEKTIEI
jgi:predicted phosphodiesterase